MNVHEYQAKAILSRYGVPVPEGSVAHTAEAAKTIAQDLTGSRVAVKAQVHAGARGKAGGVKLVLSAEEAGTAAEKILGNKIVTDQTGGDGKAVRTVLVEAAADVLEELFVAALVDPSNGMIALMAAREGGEDIEERAAKDKNLLKRIYVSPDTDPSFSQYLQLAHDLGFEDPLSGRLAKIFNALPRALAEHDASLIEINPLALTVDNFFMALDAKMVLDDNALYRHPELESLRDTDDDDPVERAAQSQEINYVGMDGDIGVIVNGAGLALATLDMLRDAGGDPANFMDIRTTALSMNIAKGVDLLLSNDRVKVLLVNMHGGGMQRCDTIVEGIGMSMTRAKRKIPIVMRAAGNNAEFAKQRLKNFGVPFTNATDMADAVNNAVSIAKGGQA